MTETSESGGLFCELNLPLEWSTTDEAAGVTPANELANQNCLKIILGLDEVIHDTADDTAELSQELQRLDFKVNVILELVGQLVAQNLTLPQSCAVKLGPATIQWHSGSSPAPVGQHLQLKLYLDQRFPFPVSLGGRVLACEQDDTGFQVQLGLDQLQEHTQELLEKYIFRCHRRHIARMRTQAGN